MPKRTDQARRIIPVTPERLCRALTDPAELTQWLPPQGMSGRFERFDFREGGGYRMILSYDAPPTGTSGKTCRRARGNKKGSFDCASLLLLPASELLWPRVIRRAQSPSFPTCGPMDALGRVLADRMKGAQPIGHRGKRDWGG